MVTRQRRALTTASTEAAAEEALLAASIRTETGASTKAAHATLGEIKTRTMTPEITTLEIAMVQTARITVETETVTDSEDASDSIEWLTETDGPVVKATGFPVPPCCFILVG